MLSKVYMIFWNQLSEASALPKTTVFVLWSSVVEILLSMNILVKYDNIFIWFNWTIELEFREQFLKLTMSQNSCLIR